METDEFGGVLVEPDRDEFGGVAVGPAPAPAPPEVPQPFLHRLALGMMIGESGQSPAELRSKGFEDFDVASNTVNQFKAGLDRVKKGFQEPFTMGGTNISDVAMGAYQAATSPLSAAFQAVGGAAEKATGGILTGDQINTALMIADGAPGQFARVRGGAQEVIGHLPQPQDFTNAAKVLAPERIVSAATRVENDIFAGPTHGETTEAAAKSRGMDVDTFIDKHTDEQAQQGFVTSSGRFVDRDEALQIAKKVDQIDPQKAKEELWGEGEPNAFFRGGLIAEVLKNTETNLRRMWTEDGIHPAEAVHDAQSDAFLKHDLTAKQYPVEMPKGEEGELLSADGRPMSLSAARTDPSELPSPDVQPVRPGLAAQASRAVEDWNGLATNVQYMLDPMATGSNRAIVPAKDAMNSVRRIRFDHARIDADLVKKFDDDALDNMWRAADEESVARQTGDIANENIGLSRLEPEQRAAVEELQQRSQAAWLQAVDAGMVEGEGLPSYTPRMMANVAMASDSLAPRSLNELGRNVFTRTAQMLRRGHLEAHETEAAAKALVGQRMAESGASLDEINAAIEKVGLVRNIRVLPLATARLQEAAVWRNMINRIEDIGKATGQDTVSYGTKPQGWFTIDHPSFRKWRPKFDDTGAVVKDSKGNTVFEPVPIYMHPEFRGPMKAILDEGSDVMKAIPGAQSGYGALMALKGKAMTAILNSPLIHNQVVWGKVAEAAGGKEWMGLGLYFRGNKIVNGVTGRAQELIERGLNPIGKRASYQDITGNTEGPEFGAPGRSLTSQIARFIPDLFDEARPNQTVGGPGDKVAAAIDKAGDFWHNTLLWDRVRDVHFGLADFLSDKMVAKGVDRLMADRIATHFSNIIVGSIPKESMSAGARATANLLLFSRSFTLGNLSTFKQAAMGLPKPVLAQIERDFGMTTEQAAEGSPEAAAQIAAISQSAKSIARRKALSTIAISVGLYYTVNALVQHAFNVISRDSSVNDELRGYVRRWNDAVNAIKEDPFEVRHLLARLSPTWDNEPWKQDRAYVGNDSRGTGIYARIPMGKFGEELTGYATKPMTMLRGKLSPLAGGLLDVLMNDRGFGQKVYNEHDNTIRGDLQTAWAVTKHLVMKHLPEGQFGAINDLLHDQADKGVNVTRLVGPAIGFTTSRGAPGGPRRGEQMEAKEDFEARFSLAWPDIKKQIQRGDQKGAEAAMKAIGVPSGMQRGLIRNAQDPASALHGRTLSDFYQYATPEQLRRFERQPGQRLYVGPSKP